MNPETVLLEAWLRADAQADLASLCPDVPELEALVEQRLEDSRARLVTMHLVDCEGCRRIVARLAAAFPPVSSASLRELLERGAVSRAWREWIGSMVTFLPPEDGDARSGLSDKFRANSPVRIDKLGRLILDVTLSQAPNPESRVRIALVHNQIRLELCTVTSQGRNLYAVVDLSALDPRAGILDEDVIEIETAAAGSLSGMLPVLEQLFAERRRGADFWDRFRPVAAAHASDFGIALARELSRASAPDAFPAPKVDRHTDGFETDAAESLEPPTTRPARKTGRPDPARADDDSAARRVQYAIQTLEDYEIIWNECNLKELPGLRETLVQLRLSVSLPSKRQPPGAEKNVHADETVTSARSRRPGA